MIEYKRRASWSPLIKWNLATINGIKIFMFDHVFGWDAECWILDECLLKKIHASWVDVLHMRFEVVLILAREYRLGIRQWSHARPNFLSGSAEDAEHSEEIIDFRVTLEHSLRVAISAKMQPMDQMSQCDDFVSVITNWDAKWATKTKVSYLDDSVLVD